MPLTSCSLLPRSLRLSFPLSPAGLSPSLPSALPPSLRSHLLRAPWAHRARHHRSSTDRALDRGRAARFLRSRPRLGRGLAQIFAGARVAFPTCEVLPTDAGLVSPSSPRPRALSWAGISSRRPRPVLFSSAPVLGRFLFCVGRARWRRRRHCARAVRHLAARSARRDGTR